ncbi:hypothetical protein ACFE33_14245 [Falsihalocynthiibacter sp. SS001]|uniref:hypothetical protein n=1 Tax=Falsihalocynthiibacter sp. SS001 TaxID=3349698 RepID=UPI0036D23DFE
MKALLIAAIGMMPNFVLAQSVSDCEWQAHSSNIAEPWEDNTRTFSNGDVRLAYLDTVEPAAGYAHLLILSPPYDEVGSRQCKTVGMSEGLGFAGLSFAELEASYDPATGLVFTVPIGIYAPEEGESKFNTLKVGLNQSSGDITAEILR